MLRYNRNRSAFCIATFSEGGEMTQRLSENLGWLQLVCALYFGSHGHGLAWPCFCHSEDTATQSRDRGTQSRRFDQDAANAISG